ILLIALSLFLASCVGPPMETDSKIAVVLDTDIGSDVDDTWALAYLLRCPELDLKLVLTGTADTHYRGRIAAKLLEIGGRTDVPVGLGPRGGSHSEFQLPWVEDYQLEDYPGTIHEDGVQAFIDLVHSSDKTIHLIAVGPIPNIKEALRRDPSIARKVKFYGMFGSIDRGYGPEPVAETNVRVDVDAFRTVHAAKWKHFEITPLDTCGLFDIGGEAYQSLKNSEDPLLRAVFENYEIWSELVTWMEVDFFEEKTSTLFDIVPIYMVMTHEHIEFEKIRISVTDNGFTIRDPKGKKTSVAIRWKDLEAFREHVVERLHSAG
ncbi:MAG: nucleoside hydrolase, partial [Puniceicoccaceae bacterium]